MSSTWSTGAPTRRGVLTAGSALAAGVALGAAGCSDDGGSADPDRMKIPDAEVKLPKGDVQLRLMDSGDTKVPFWEDLAAAYQKKHGNISVEYDPLPWNRIEEVVPLGIRNSTAHDLMQLPFTIPLPQAVSEGWVAPLDDLIPDFGTWQKTFPEGTFVEGVGTFDGKLYQVPLASEQRHWAMLLYHRQLMNDAGYDPESEPLTWDTYRAAARKITKRGDGRTYGVVLEAGQPDRLATWVQYQAASAGTASVNYYPYLPYSFINPRNGEFFYTEDGVADAVELLLALKKDGSVFPGSNSLAAPEAWPRVPRGHAAMVSAGPWVTEVWLRDNAGFDFGVAGHPVTGSGGDVPPNYPAFGTDFMVVFAESKVKEVAADILSYATSLPGQRAWGDTVGVGNPPINEEARRTTGRGTEPQAKRSFELAKEMRVRPEPMIRNPQIHRAAQELKSITPDFGELLQAIYLGKAGDTRKELQGLQDRSNQQLDAAIKAARAEGADVSRADFAFPDWDPGSDYADYQAR